MATCEIDQDTKRLEMWSYDPMFSLPLENPDIMGEEQYVSADLCDWVYDEETALIHYDAEPERARIRRIGELKTALCDTDQKVIHMDEPIAKVIGTEYVTTLEEALALLNVIVDWSRASLDKFGRCVERREGWREELEELEDE